MYFLENDLNNKNRNKMLEKYILLELLLNKKEFNMI